MLQHDLKFNEKRLGDGSRLVAWCICGKWRYESTNLDQTPMINEFFDHLDSIIDPTTRFAANDPNRPF